MVRPIPEVAVNRLFPSSLPLAVGLFVSVIALVALCAKRRSTRKGNHELNDTRVPPKRPLEPISSKAPGQEGVWQKNILMGDKCRPLEFSGVIYYDNYGHRVPEMPRSPRRPPFDAPSSPLRTFTFPLPATT